MSKKTKPAQEMGMPAGELPEETKNAIEAAALQAENEQTQEPENPELRRLRNEVELLRSQLNRQPENLDDQIKFFKRKQELINRLGLLLSSIDRLEEHTEAVRKEAEEDIFSSENYALKLTAKKGYSSEEDIFKFRNSAIIAELLNFVHARMMEKKEGIEEEIAA